MRKSFLVLVLLFLSATHPVWGGTAYSYGVNKVVGGNQFNTQIRVSNDSGAPQSLFYLFIPAGTNGTNIDRETESVEVTVAPRATIRLDDLLPENSRGLIEFRADDEVVVTARLVGTNSRGASTFGVEIPVIDSTNAVAPGRTGYLQGLSRTEGAVLSDFFIANLSIERAVCAVEARKRGGLLIVDQTINVAPLTLSPFIDVLSLLGVDNAGDVSLAVTCDQLARPFALVQQVDTAQRLFIQPSGGGASRIDPFPSNDCPADSDLVLNGVFHVPDSRNERATFVVPTNPGDTFSRLTLSLEITHGGWNRVSSGNHAGFWVQRTNRWSGNLFGYLNFFGPNRHFTRLATNVDLARGVINSVQQGAVLEEGETYVINYTYDTGANFIEAIVSTKGGVELIRLNDRPTVRRISAQENFQLVFGHTSHEEGPEVTTYNWRYANLCFNLE